MISDPPYCIQTPPTGLLSNLAEHPLSPGTGNFCPATCILLCFHCTLLPWGCKIDTPTVSRSPPPLLGQMGISQGTRIAEDLRIPTPPTGFTPLLDLPPYVLGPSYSMGAPRRAPL